MSAELLALSTYQTSREVARLLRQVQQATRRALTACRPSLARQLLFGRLGEQEVIDAVQAADAVLGECEARINACATGLQARSRCYRRLADRARELAERLERGPRGPRTAARGVEARASQAAASEAALAAAMQEICSTALPLWRSAVSHMLEGRPGPVTVAQAADWVASAADAARKSLKGHRQ